MGRGLHRGTEERPELIEENKVEQDANPSAAAAPPPFDKGGRGLASGLTEIAAAKVPLAKGGKPAGLGGFYEILVQENRPPESFRASPPSSPPILLFSCLIPVFGLR